MLNYFEVKVKYTKQLESGEFKRVTEPSLIQASTFGDAENRTYQEIGEFVRGEFAVVAIKVVDFADIFRYDDEEVWYSAVLEFETADADSGKGKKTKQNMLVTANSVKQACERFNLELGNMMAAYEIHSIKKTNLQDVYPVSVDTIADVMDLVTED